MKLDFETRLLLRHRISEIRRETERRLRLAQMSDAQFRYYEEIATRDDNRRAVWREKKRRQRRAKAQ